MSNPVWISGAMMNPSRHKPFTSASMETNIQGVIHIIERNDGGEALADDCFPAEFWGAGRFKPGIELPSLFPAGGYWVVSSRCADVLRQGDLGAGGLYPTTLFQKDRKTALAGSYFCLNFGNVKNVFLADQSTADQNPFNPKVWYPEGAMKDDDIAVSRAALEGPDIWVSPPLKRAFFVSDSLARSLRSAKVADAFDLYRCRVI